MEVFKGYVDHIVYRNEENGYTVFELTEAGEDAIFCVGTFPGLDAGETVEVEGTLVDHPVYGTQIKASTWRVVPPDDVTSMERYLASGAVKGIGPALAARIIKKFGDDTFRIMEEEPELLTSVKGISERIAREIADQMEEKKDLRNAMVFLQQYGISNTLAVKIYDTYGTERLYQVLRENPYKMAEDISGVGFKIADGIAARIGIHSDSEYRIRSGLLYCLLQAEADGHSFLPEEVLKEKAE
ncbi:MAG: ATP-dependent RecD-like DNA helicase, partial [Lachnospiraceae bacterium]|nr:ATP-dependent RecD-like DNA helicase [Lachnospiraceae bacterium]